MNVRVAAQTFSSSVADALQFLMESGHIEFKDAAGTIKFICIIDRLFDMFNSKNPFAKGFKRPLDKNSFKIWDCLITESINYLKSLKTSDKVPIFQHRRKTFVIGVIILAQSIRAITCHLLYRTVSPFKYVLAYKLSQDHLELLFACIRGKNGFNSNPNVRHFESSLKRILLRNTIVVLKYANCLVFEPQSIG